MKILEKCDDEEIYMLHCHCGAYLGNVLCGEAYENQIARINVCCLKKECIKKYEKAARTLGE